MARRRMTGDVIELDYNGRELAFREDRDEWSCPALKLTSKSLAALKRKIDRLDSEARRVSVSAVRIDSYRQGQRVDVVLIAKPKDWDRAGYSGEAYNRRVPAVWVIDRSGNRDERIKVRLDSLAPADVNTFAALKEATRLQQESKRLDEQADAIIAGIILLTLDDLVARGAKEEALDDE